MRGLLLWCLPLLVLGACSTDDGDAGVDAATGCAAEPGSVTDVETEPDWRPYADYRPWTTPDGCLVRIDVLAERPGPDHCDWGDADVLIAGSPLGERYSSVDDSVHFVRDPEGVFGQPELAEGYDPDAELPAAAVDSGFRRDGIALWHVPNDASAVWLVAGEWVGRWPGGDPPLCA